MRQHSNLSPSSAQTWARCPGSIRQQEGITEHKTEYSSEGDVAHELAEMSLIEEVTDCTELADTAKWRYPEVNVTQEMIDSVNDYIKRVYKERRNGELVVEHQISYDEVIPGGYGYCDALVVGRNRIKVIDFKYGKGIRVHPDNNYQLLLYGLGAYLEYSSIMKINAVDLLICQPRMGNWPKWTISPAKLMKFSRWIAERAADTEDPDAPLVPGAVQCQFCKAKHGCPGRAKAALELAQVRKASVELPSAEVLTSEQLSYVLKRLPEFKKWANDIQNYALDQMKQGLDIPGFKLVEGRSRTVFLPEAEQYLKEYIPDEQLYETKMIGITKIRSLLGKSAREILDQCTRREPGAPTMTQADDIRPEFNSVKQDFGELE